MKTYKSDELNVLSNYLKTIYGYSLRDFKVSHSPHKIEDDLWCYTGEDFTLILKGDDTLLLENDKSEEM